VTLPVFIEEAGGGMLVDVDGNHIIDLACGIGVTGIGASSESLPPTVTATISASACPFASSVAAAKEKESHSFS
jgi:4-aminobutyrate aminotransferase/(S)-3-amino-2-methylpropionate transaminase